MNNKGINVRNIEHILNGNERMKLYNNENIKLLGNIKRY